MIGLVIGRLLGGTIRKWVDVLIVCFAQSWFLYQFLFLYFALIYVGSYLLFLIVEQHRLAMRYQQLAWALVKSLIHSLLMVTLLISLYEICLPMVLGSKLFVQCRMLAGSLSLLQQPAMLLYHMIAGATVLLNSFLFYHAVSKIMLSLQTAHFRILYGLTLVLMGLTCLGSLQMLGYW